MILDKEKLLLLETVEFEKIFLHKKVRVCLVKGEIIEGYFTKIWLAANEPHLPVGFFVGEIKVDIIDVVSLELL